PIRRRARSRQYPADCGGQSSCQRQKTPSSGPTLSSAKSRLASGPRRRRLKLGNIRRETPTHNSTLVRRETIKLGTSAGAIAEIALRNRSLPSTASRLIAVKMRFVHSEIELSSDLLKCRGS